MKLLRTVALVPIAVGIATAYAAANAEDSRQLAEKANTYWAKSLNSGDVKALAQTYAEDAIMLPPTDETLVSRPVIQDFWGKSVSRGLGNYHVDVVSARMDGNSLYQAGIWSATKKATDGSTQRIGGNVVRVLERQNDGNWKTRLETWN